MLSAVVCSECGPAGALSLRKGQRWCERAPGLLVSRTAPLDLCAELGGGAWGHVKDVAGAGALLGHFGRGQSCVR